MYSFLEPWLTHEEAMQLNDSNSSSFKQLLPSVLISYVGEKQGGRAIDKLMDMIDNPYVLKSLMYTIVDKLLMQVFPELREKMVQVPDDK